MRERDDFTEFLEAKEQGLGDVEEGPRLRQPDTIYKPIFSLREGYRMQVGKPPSKRRQKRIK